MPQYSEEEAREAVAASRSYAEALRRLGLRPAGGNHALFKKWVSEWRIPTGHFDPHDASRRADRGTPMEEVLVEHSPYSRNSLKKRLYATGLKRPVCELCGQGEIWRGHRISLVLDHVNGVPDDNRLENLRILCPNCNSTLDTHCGRHNRQQRDPQPCARCGDAFTPKRSRQRYCSATCGRRAGVLAGVPKPHLRKVQRPPYAQLVAEIEATSWLAVGRKYGVSDNAVRKWVRQYEAEEEARRRVTKRKPHRIHDPPLHSPVRCFAGSPWPSSPRSPRRPRRSRRAIPSCR